MNPYENYRFQSGVSIRGAEGEAQKITGMAIPYDQWTTIRTQDGLFLEKIQRGALTETLAKGNVIDMHVNHERRTMIGSTSTNLTLFDRPDGLYFELIADNEKAFRMIDGVRTGFFDKCSFEFRKTDWLDEDLGGFIFRTIKKMELYEISLVDDPAYKQTSARTNGMAAGGDSIRTAMALNRTEFATKGYEMR